MFKGYSFVIADDSELAKAVVEHGGIVLEMPRRGCIFITSGNLDKSTRSKIGDKLETNETGEWHLKSAWVRHSIKAGWPLIDYTCAPNIGYWTHEAPVGRFHSIVEWTVLRDGKYITAYVDRDNVANVDEVMTEDDEDYDFRKAECI